MAASNSGGLRTSGNAAERPASPGAPPGRPQPAVDATGDPFSSLVGREVHPPRTRRLRSTHTSGILGEGGVDMAYQLRAGGSLESMIDYSIGAHAGLAVPDEGLEDLAPPFADFIARARAARDARDDARYAWIRSIAVFRARDLRWDGTIVGLSGEAYHASGKQADAEPYALLFGTVKANDARKLGAAKASAFGATLAKKLDTLNHPDLAGQADAVRAANDALIRAATAKVEAYDAVLMHSIKRVHLLNELHTLIATTEAAILTRYPGDSDRVRAALAPQRREERGSEDASEGTEGDSQA